MGDGIGKRPFWMHQLVEYILGWGVVASGLQSPDAPRCRRVLGGFIMLNAPGGHEGPRVGVPASARSVHRTRDTTWWCSSEVMRAVQPWIETSTSAAG